MARDIGIEGGTKTERIGDQGVVVARGGNGDIEAEVRTETKAETRRIAKNAMRDDLEGAAH